MTRLLPICLLVAAAPADEPRLPAEKPAGKPELVATFDDPMPTGVTVSHKGRVFVNYPRWGDPMATGIDQRIQELNQQVVRLLNRAQADQAFLLATEASELARQHFGEPAQLVVEER